MRWRTYAAWDALAAATWAVYASALGYVSGRTFESSFVVPLAISLGLAAALGATAELVARRRRRART
jgi:membrane protein DedA with SNARE-associated domain